MQKIASIKFPLIQITFYWLLRFLFCFIIYDSLYHYNENPMAVIIVSLMLLILIIFLIQEHEIIVYDEFFIFRKKYFFNLIQKDKRFNYSDILETDGLGRRRPTHFYIIQNDKKITINTLFFYSDLIKAKEQINKQINIYKR